MSQIEVNVDELKVAITSFQMELNNYKSAAKNYENTCKGTVFLLIGVSVDTTKIPTFAEKG